MSFDNVRYRFVFEPKWCDAGGCDFTRPEVKEETTAAAKVNRRQDFKRVEAKIDFRLDGVGDSRDPPLRVPRAL